MPQDIHAPVLPPKPTPDQIVAWTQQMQAYNAAHPTPSIGEDIGAWFQKNVGGIGSSTPSFPSQAQPPMQQRAVQAALAPPKPAPTPKSLQQDIQLPKRPSDINLPKDAFMGPEAPSVPDWLTNDVNTVEQGQAHLGPNDGRFSNLNLQDPYTLWSNTPGKMGVEGAPSAGAPDPSIWDQAGNFLNGGESTFSGEGDSKSLGGLAMQDWLGIAGLGLGAFGAYKQAKTQGDQFNQQLDLQKQQLAQQNDQFSKSLAQQGSQFQQNLGQQQATTGLNATQLDPYVQQNSLASSALRRALLTDGPAQAQLGSPNTFDPGKGNRAAVANQYLNDGALANAAGNFETARHHADPTGTPLDLSKTGLGQAGTDANAAVAAAGTGVQPVTPPSAPLNQQALQAALMQGTNTTPEQKDTGGGFWKTLGKIGAFAAPIIAAPFTGGASLAAIGALSGAAGGALNGGGLKSILLGAGLGAIPGLGTSKGLAQGAVAPALGAGLKQAGTSVLKNPQLALQAALLAKR